MLFVHYKVKIKLKNNRLKNNPRVKHQNISKLMFNNFLKRLSVFYMLLIGIISNLS